MKYLFAVLSVSLVLIGVLPLKAQQQYGIEWADTLDSGYNDEAYGIAIDGSGNVYVTGSYFPGTNLIDYLTVKYNPSGTVIQADTLNYNTYDYSCDVAVDKNGYIYVTGCTSEGSNSDYLTVKYNSLDSILWTRTINRTNYDYAYGIAVDSAGNVYVTGNADDDYFTVKYNAAGDTIWTRTIDNGSYDDAYAIAVDDSGNVYVTGSSVTDTTDYDYFTVKYNPDGNIVWADTFDNGGKEDQARDIAIDRDGNIYVTGYTDNGSNNDYLTVKYDSLGNLVWKDTIDNGDDDEAYGIAVDDSGNIYVTGQSIFAGGARKCFSVKYDKDGNIIGSNTDLNVAFIQAIAVEKSGNNFYVTGYYDNGSDHDYLTLKYAKYKDAGILSIISPDTVGTDSSYTPQIWVKNNSYQDTLNFDIAAYIDSTGGNMYADTQNISNLSVGDSVLVSFSPWTAPSNPVDLNLRFSIITGDMNADNDTISKPLYVKDMSGILNKDINRTTMLNVSTINKGSISFSYNIAKSGNYEINVYTIDGRIIRKIEGKGSGYHIAKFSNLPSGIYFLRLKQGEDVVNKKVILVK